VTKPAKPRTIEIKNALQQLTFQDLHLFEAVARQGSLAAAARELHFRSPFVTKAIQAIESRLGKTLLKRTSVGITLTPEGRDFLAFCKKILESLDQTQWVSSRATEIEQIPLVTAVGPHFLLAHLAGPYISQALRDQSVGICLVDMGNSQMLASSLHEFFDMALHCDELSWSRAWQSYPLGTIEWVLCARAGHPLVLTSGGRATEKEVLQFPFLLPAVINSQGHRVADDYCPVPPPRRSRISEASSGEIGLRAVEHTDELIFVPEIQARDMVRNQRIRIIEVTDWVPVRKTAYLTVHQDKLKQNRVRAILQALEAGLKAR
jgi:DNA-binding transcriptional LysR family regulator